MNDAFYVGKKHRNRDPVPNLTYLLSDDQKVKASLPRAKYYLVKF